MTISPEMQTKIQLELDRIEREYDVTILYACESGSRAWGFPSKDSDYDVRIVYHHSIDWYLRLERRRDVIEEPIHDLLDIAGWDLGKTLQLLRKSNPNILEWAGSPVIYRESPEFGLLRELLTKSFDHRSSVLHYLNMGLNNKREWLGRDEVKIKKYLYCLRPLLCAYWVLKHDSQPPMLYHELLHDLYPDTRLEREIEELIVRKQDMNELDLVPRNAWLNEWIDGAIEDVGSTVPAKQTMPAWDAYDRVFRSIVG